MAKEFVTVTPVVDAANNRLFTASGWTVLIGRGGVFCDAPAGVHTFSYFRVG